MHPGIEHRAASLSGCAHGCIATPHLSAQGGAAAATQFFDRAMLLRQIHALSTQYFKARKVRTRGAACLPRGARQSLHCGLIGDGRGQGGGPRATIERVLCRRCLISNKLPLLSRTWFLPKVGSIVELDMLTPPSILIHEGNG